MSDVPMSTADATVTRLELSESSENLSIAVEPAVVPSEDAPVAAEATSTAPPEVAEVAELEDHLAPDLRLAFANGTPVTGKVDRKSVV